MAYLFTSAGQSAKPTANPPVAKSTAPSGAIAPANPNALLTQMFPRAVAPEPTAPYAWQTTAPNAPIRAYSEPFASLYGYNPSDDYLIKERQILDSVHCLPLDATAATADNIRVYTDRRIPPFMFPIDDPKRGRASTLEEYVPLGPASAVGSYYPSTWSSDVSTWNTDEHNEWRLRILRYAADCANWARWFMLTKEFQKELYTRFGGAPLLVSTSNPSGPWDSGIGTNVWPRLQLYLSVRQTRTPVARIIDERSAGVWTSFTPNPCWTRKDHWDPYGEIAAPFPDIETCYMQIKRPAETVRPFIDNISVGTSASSAWRGWHSFDTVTRAIRWNPLYVNDLVAWHDSGWKGALATPLTGTYDNGLYSHGPLAAHEFSGHGFLGLNHYGNSDFPGLIQEIIGQGYSVSANYADGAYSIQYATQLGWGTNPRFAYASLMNPDLDFHGKLFSEYLGINILYQP